MTATECWYPADNVEGSAWAQPHISPAMCSGTKSEYSSPASRIAQAANPLRSSLLPPSPRPLMCSNNHLRFLPYRRRHERPLSRILAQLPWDLTCLLNPLRFLPCRRRHERILPQLPWDLMCLLNLLRFLPILQLLQLHLRLISPRLADAHAAMPRLNPFRITKTILRLSIERSICSSLFPFDKIEGRSLVYVPELFVKRINHMHCNLSLK